MYYWLLILAITLNQVALFGAGGSSKQPMTALKPDHLDMTFLQHLHKIDHKLDPAPEIKKDGTTSLTVIVVDPMANLLSPAKDQLESDDNEDDAPIKEKSQGIECLQCGRTINIIGIGTHLKKHALAYDPKAVQGAIKMLKEGAL